MDSLLWLPVSLRITIQEGKILEEAINLSDINEMDFEWLEGMARYAEYIAEVDSTSIVSRKLINISEEVATNGDDRYYTLGMAQVILIQKLKIDDWQEKLFYQKYTPEQILREYSRKG